MTGRITNGRKVGPGGNTVWVRRMRAGKTGQSVTGRLIRYPKIWLATGLLILLPGLPLPGPMHHGVPQGTAQAAQYRVAGEEAAVAAVVSMREITRIALRGDRITGVVVRPRGFVIEHDAGNGDVFLVPGDAGLPAAAINMFVSSEDGRTWQLLLTPRDVPAEQIVLVGPRPADPRLSRAPRREALAHLARAMITGALLEDYARAAPVPADLDHLPMVSVEGGVPDIGIVEAWQGARFRGLDVRTGGALPGSVLPGSVLPDADRLAPHAAAVWVSADRMRAVVIIEAEDGW